jgi:hypothetical protein
MKAYYFSTVMETLKKNHSSGTNCEPAYPLILCCVQEDVWLENHEK